MSWIVQHLWLIPALPVGAAALTAVMPQRCRVASATLAVASMTGSLLLSLCAFAHMLNPAAGRQFVNVPWLRFAEAPEGLLRLGWVLDPLTAAMLVMVTFVGLLIFIYSVGYMSHDDNFTRFFCFLSLFAGAMLGVVIANSLLLLFVCWEIVGLTSYLLIGFWYHKPSAAAAAKKAFITTRIGDLALLIGMVWLYSQTSTLIFYDNGRGCLEFDALADLVSQITRCGMALSTAIGLLIFCGAVGKSGQVPLHVWLPDAMEGPTPVSALIHAATMVAAGVFLVARVYPLMSATPDSVALMSTNRGSTGTPPPYVEPAQKDSAHAAPENSAEQSAKNPPTVQVTSALRVITWIGAITAIFAASIAVAQTDIKRILAYSTVSQLGYMMLGLGTGGVAVGMFHLITHAFFKALLFMGAGSVIHGCHEEQDIRHMGGLRRWMPVTFATYAVGMLALAGFPLFFSGFWSKDEILHSAFGWPASRWPFILGIAGAFLTAFYMTRQVAIVFFGKYRGKPDHDSAAETLVGRDSVEPGTAGLQDSTESRPAEPLHAGSHDSSVHESPFTMTGPLTVLAVCAIALGFIGTPVWPWFQKFLAGEQAGFDPHGFSEGGVLSLMLFSTVVVLLGLIIGWWFYGRKPMTNVDDLDPVERLRPDIFSLLRNKYYVDEIYEATVIRFTSWWCGVCRWLDTWVWNGVIQAVTYVTIGLSWLNRLCDEYVVNLGFDEGCRDLRTGGRWLSRLQNGRVQNYLRWIGVGLIVLVLLLIRGSSK